LDDGYELFLMSDLPKEAMPEKGKIYVEQIGEQLRYILQDPNANKVDSLLDIKIANFSRKTLIGSRFYLSRKRKAWSHT
jgi:hypothetical protein